MTKKKNTNHRDVLTIETTFKYIHSNGWSNEPSIIHVVINQNNSFSNTYVNPTRNRVANNIVLFTEKLDSALNRKPNSNENRNTFRRPHVSAIKPQKCELITTPTNATALMTPCSTLLIFSSHFATGSTYPIDMPSAVMPSNAAPTVIRTSQ